jgi:glucose-1-phosphate adenylyltransferase
LGEFIEVIPAQQRISSDWYKGTADAIYQNLYVIGDTKPEMIMILAGDHVYKMNYMDMIQLHHSKQADATIACVPMPKETSRDFGVVEVDTQNFVTGFQEKPQKPNVIPNEPDKIFASMGIYLFNKNALVEELQIDAQDLTSSHDFGKNIIPQMLKSNKRVCVYNYVNEKGQPRYWRDIGTRDAYYQTNMDLLKTDMECDLFDQSWPVRTFQEQYPPIKMMGSTSGPGQVIDSMISGGCVVRGGYVKRSILSPNVHVYEGAIIENSIIMEGVVIGPKAKIKNAIIDKEVFVPPNATIGYNEKLDRKRFVLTTSGIVIVPKRTQIMPE